VWTFIRSSDLPHPGRNLALYLDSEINLEVGVEMLSRSPATSKCSARRLRRDSRDGCTWGHTTPGEPMKPFTSGARSWLRVCRAELGVYGHWDDDPAKLRTDVFYLLQAGSKLAG